ncbi:MAG: polysaccharide biosynthesis/export family protein, partial [Candidatus Rokuibacteriota bacterium]
MTRGIVVSAAITVVGLALGACAGVGRDAAPLSAGAPATMPTAPAAVPTVTPPPAAPASTASALNCSLLTQTTPPAEEGDLPLGPGDLIEVAVFEVPEFDKLKIRIPNGGTITLPLIGAMPAAGLTPSELQSAIRLRLQEKYIHTP